MGKGSVIGFCKYESRKGHNYQQYLRRSSRKTKKCAHLRAHLREDFSPVLILE